MKRYLLILTALMVVVGILGLPPRVYTASWWFRVQNRSAERQRHLDLRDEIQFESWLGGLLISLLGLCSPEW